MSRTDKDRPWWLSEWYEPHHMRCIHDMRYRIWHLVYERDTNGNCIWDRGLIWRRGSDFRTCDLPAEPERGKSKPAVWRLRRGMRVACTWEPIPDPDQNSARYNWRPTRDKRHDEWWHPDRARVRDWLIEATKEYHGTGEINDDRAPLIRPRHGSITGWW